MLQRTKTIIVVDDDEGKEVIWPGVGQTIFLFCPFGTPTSIFLPSILLFLVYLRKPNENLQNFILQAFGEVY